MPPDPFVMLVQPVAHVVGLPVEEVVLAAAPVLGVWAGIALMTARERSAAVRRIVRCASRSDNRRANE